jgi:hypothetical protein
VEGLTRSTSDPALCTKSAMCAPIVPRNLNSRAVRLSHHTTDLHRCPRGPAETAISGKTGEGTNSTYCHPRKETVDALTAVLPMPLPSA